jgi:hypothetical protein
LVLSYFNSDRDIPTDEAVWSFARQRDGRC